MQVIIAELERSVREVPQPKLPILLATLAALTAHVQMRMMQPEPVSRETEDLLTIPEVAKRLNVSTYRAYELARQGLLKSVRLGKSVRVKLSAVADYLAQRGA